MALDANTTLQHSPKVPWRAVDEKGILVDQESGYYFSLNKTGRFIWEKIDGKRSLRDIAAGMVERFEVDEETALKDCMELAERLLDQGLLTTITT